MHQPEGCTEKNCKLSHAWCPAREDDDQPHCPDTNIYRVTDDRDDGACEKKKKARKFGAKEAKGGAASLAKDPIDAAREAHYRPGNRIQSARPRPGPVIAHNKVQGWVDGVHHGGWRSARHARALRHQSGPI